VVLVVLVTSPRPERKTLLSTLVRLSRWTNLPDPCSLSVVSLKV
jgi:hypothetical protein